MEIECRNCKLYEGDCGHHFKDGNGHINYDCPSEGCCDRYGQCACYEEKRNEYQIQLEALEGEEVTYLNRKILREALKKQIPKMPNIWGDGYADGHPVCDMWECPGCGKNYELEYDEHDYCPNCGQKIDWKREEDDTDETEKEDQKTE